MHTVCTQRCMRQLHVFDVTVGQGPPRTASWFGDLWQNHVAIMVAQDLSAGSTVLEPASLRAFGEGHVACDHVACDFEGEHEDVADNSPCIKTSLGLKSKAGSKMFKDPSIRMIHTRHISPHCENDSL